MYRRLVMIKQGQVLRFFGVQKIFYFLHYCDNLLLLLSLLLLLLLLLLSLLLLLLL